MTVCEAYSGRRVLVTGLTGFKGVWLARWLQQLDAAVTELHWQLLLSVAERVAWSIEWFKANLQEPDLAWDLTREQIRRFTARIAECPAFAARWFPTSVAKQVAA